MPIVNTLKLLTNNKLIIHYSIYMHISRTQIYYYDMVQQCTPFIIYIRVILIFMIIALRQCINFNKQTICYNHKHAIAHWTQNKL